MLVKLRATLKASLECTTNVAPVIDTAAFELAMLTPDTDVADDVTARAAAQPFRESRSPTTALFPPI